MSYDVHIRRSECPTCGHEPDDDFWANYTYNLSGYFMAVIPGGLRALHEMACPDAAKVLACAITAHAGLSADSLAAYEPPNGYGSVEGARRLLVRLLAACTDAPAGQVRVT